MAKAKQPEAIQGLLQQTLKASGLGHLLHESRLRERWKELMGERAAKIETVLIRAPWFYGPNQPPRHRWPGRSPNS